MGYTNVSSCASDKSTKHGQHKVMASDGRNFEKAKFNTKIFDFDLKNAKMCDIMLY